MIRSHRFLRVAHLHNKTKIDPKLKNSTNINAKKVIKLKKY